MATPGRRLSYAVLRREPRVARFCGKLGRSSIGGEVRSKLRPLIHAHARKQRACEICGAIGTTSYALGRRGDNMYCNDARTSHFIQLSSLSHVDAKYSLHGAGRGSFVGDGGYMEWRSHETPRDSAEVFDVALLHFACVLSAV